MAKTHTTRIEVSAVFLPITRDMLAAAIATAEHERGMKPNDVAALDAVAVWDALFAQLPRRKQKESVVSTYVDDGGGHRWRMTAPNGEIVSSGEAHTRAGDAKRAGLSMIQAPKILRTEGA